MAGACCNGRERANKLLARSGYKLREAVTLNPGDTLRLAPPMIAVERLNPEEDVRREPPTLLCTCCPFCGKDLPI